MIHPETAIDVFNNRYGVHERRRALHAKGSWCEGRFTATPEAAALTRAAHLQGQPVPALIRVSNGAGNPNLPDYAPDVRGLAVSFTLPDGSKTDMVAQSTPKFFNHSPDDFVDLIRSQTGRAAVVKFPLYLARHPAALRHAGANSAALQPVTSYARCSYYGVHAFRWIDAEGSATNVRWEWRPLEGDQRTTVVQARLRGRDYLQEELADRLAKGPARFTLDVQLGEPGDPTRDPSKHWPSSRRHLAAGTLELTRIVDDPETDGHIVVFDPTRLTDGIELTDDVILNYRAAAYSSSAARRA